MASTDLPAPNTFALGRRAAETMAVLLHRFAPLVARKLAGLSVSEQEFAVALRSSLASLGATYAKLGQLLASSPTLFGEETAAECRSLLDTGPAVSLRDLQSTVLRELGRPLGQLFPTFDVAPIGSASLAVVHRAVTADGRRVAVKILRPGIEEAMAADLAVMGPALEMIVGIFGSDIGEPLEEFVRAFREQVTEELDLRREAAVMTRHRLLLEAAGVAAIAIPVSHADLSTRRILTMELLEGVPIDDLAGIAGLGVDPRPLVEQAIRAWLTTTVRHGTFHGDIHAGNLLVLRDGRLGIVDWGIEGRLDAETLGFLRMVLAASLGDERAWADVGAWLQRSSGAALTRTVGVSGDELPEFFRLHIEPLLTRPFGEASLAGLVAGLQRMRLGSSASRGVLSFLKRAVAARLRGPRRSGGEPGRLDRGLILLGKQLVYFERYGKLFLRDAPLFADRELVASLLAER